MDAEDIVRALAAADQPCFDMTVGGGGNYPSCLFCDGDPDYGSGPSNHEPDCPWRLAREWVEAVDGQPSVGGESQ